MNDTASILGGAALLLGAAAFAIRSVAQAKKDAPPQNGVDERRTTAALQRVIDRIDEMERELGKNMDATRHALANPLQGVILLLHELKHDLETLTKGR